MDLSALDNTMILARVLQDDDVVMLSQKQRVEHFLNFFDLFMGKMKLRSGDIGAIGVVLDAHSFSNVRMSIMYANIFALLCNITLIPLRRWGKSGSLAEYRRHILPKLARTALHEWRLGNGKNELTPLYTHEPHITHSKKTKLQVKCE